MPDTEYKLYYFPECPFCQKVLKTISETGLVVELVNIREIEGAREELIEKGGKSTVPCLNYNNGEDIWMYESSDISNYIKSISCTK